MNAGDISQPQSWRAKKQEPGNRAVHRFIASLFVIGLIALFASVLWHWWQREDSRLRTFLVHSGGYDLEVVMPLMYGERAGKHLHTQLSTLKRSNRGVVKEITGDVNNIWQSLDAELQQAAADPDDAILLIVRGYLLLDANGQPAIACSDLQPGSSSLKPASGLLELSKVLKALTSLPPGGSPAKVKSRLLVLDIEPLAALQRLNQFGEESIDEEGAKKFLFEQLDQIVKELDTALNDKLWVLVTRGPLQNAGWDPKLRLPVSTITLTNALTGAADLDGDGDIGLSEICQDLSSRYRSLAVSGAPGIVLLRGGTGVVVAGQEGGTRIPNDRLVRVEQAETDPEEATAPEAIAPEAVESDGQPKEDGQARTDNTTRPINSSDATTLVRLQAPQQPAASAGSNTTATGSEAGSSQLASPAGSPADTNASASGQAAGSIPKAVAGGTNAAAAVGPPEGTGVGTGATGEPIAAPVVTFWDVRDTFENPNSLALPHPIAVAPHLWRDIVESALRAQVKEFDQDPAEAASSGNSYRLRLLQEATEDLEKFFEVTDAERLKPGKIRDLYVRWRRAGRNDPSSSSSQVRAADELQYLVAIVGLRQWGFRLHSEQATHSGGLYLTANLRSLLDQARLDGQTTLVAEQGEEIRLQQIERNIANLRIAIKTFDDQVESEISTLIDDVKKNVRNKAEEGPWKLTLQLYAWLRSPLATGGQRKRIMEVLHNVSIATPTTNPGQRLEFASLSDSVRYRDLTAYGGDVRGQLVDRLARNDADGGTFGGALDDVMNLVGLGLSEPGIIEQTPPLMHLVKEPRPKPSEFKIEILDASGSPVGNLHSLESAAEALVVRVTPGTHQNVDLILAVKTDTRSTPSMRAAWDGADRSQPDTRRVDFVGGRERDSTLRITAPFASNDLSEVELTIEVTSVTGQPALNAKETSRTVRLALPRRDRILLRGIAKGMSKPSVDSEPLELPGGIWLKTFASRESSFSLELKNNRGRAVRARIWLVALPNPFRDEEIDGYRPGLILRPETLEYLRNQLLGRDGLADPKFLATYRLMGPVDLDVPGREQEWMPLNWLAPAAGQDDPSATANGSPATPALSPAAGGPTAGKDVSHGMALIVRLLNGGGEARQQDQVLWLIPKPWLPSEYVSTEGNDDEIKFSNARIFVRTSIIRDIDGDGADDRIPDVTADNPVLVSWSPDENWRDFDPRSLRQLRSQTNKLLYTRRTGEEMQVEVKPNARSLTFVRLGVDGWPRALHYAVRQIEGRLGTYVETRDNVGFASVEMTYGDPPPGGEADFPLGATSVHDFPAQDQPVVFRSPGVSLNVRLHADFSIDPGNEIGDPSEIRIIAGNQTLGRYWSDREIRTTATEINAQDGQIKLLTTVNDLQFNAENLALGLTPNVKFQALLFKDGNLREPTELANLDLILDSNPPDVISIKPDSVPPYIAGNPVRWSMSFQDVDSNVTHYWIGPDEDGDGLPDGDANKDRRPVPPTGKVTQSFTAKADKELLRVAARVWDAAGLASQPKGDSVTIAKPVVTPATDGTKPAGPTAPKRGVIAGRILDGRTYRGKFFLSPMADGVSKPFEEAQGRGNPTFEFGNVPEGDYQIKFDGTVQGSAGPPMIWKGLKIKPPGSSPHQLDPGSSVRE